MSTRKTGGDHLAPFKNVLFFGLLLILSLVFFVPTRDNSFWHPSDYFLLQQSLDVERSWRQIFTADATQPFQPLVKLVFHLEYQAFGLDAYKYYLFNIILHSLNAFLVYLLVFTLLRDQHISVLSSVLFACAVGNYGKAIIVASGIADLVIALLTLLTLLLYFRNELHNQGRMLSLYYFGSLTFFVLSLLTKATSFSILGCMLAFNIFYRDELNKPVLHKGFLTITVVALLALVSKLTFLPDASAMAGFHIMSFGFFKNVGSYLVRLIFPIHTSPLVRDAGFPIRAIYQLATEIRLVTFLVILSYTVFGFIFGNRTIRFFIAWTYITLLPFCFFDFPSDWFNIRYLYLVSIGFAMLLASATVLASRLLYQKTWRRFLPYVMPGFFVLLSQFVVFQLDKNCERKARSAQIEALRTAFLEKRNSGQMR